MRRGEPSFALVADGGGTSSNDFRPMDWGLLGCWFDKDDDSVYITTVGTFGFASARYYLSRPASALGRLEQYVKPHWQQTWHTLMPKIIKIRPVASISREGFPLFFRTRHLVRSSIYLAQNRRRSQTCVGRLGDLAYRAHTGHHGETR